MRRIIFFRGDLFPSGEWYVARENLLRELKLIPQHVRTRLRDFDPAIPFPTNDESRSDRHQRREQREAVGFAVHYMDRLRTPGESGVNRVCKVTPSPRFTFSGRQASPHRRARAMTRDRFKPQDTERLASAISGYGNCDVRKKTIPTVVETTQTVSLARISDLGCIVRDDHHP